MGSLYDELIKYSNGNTYGFHMPGHKRNDVLMEGESPYKYDITEIDGFDNLHHPEGIIREELNRITKIFGGERAWISVNGSTGGILAAVSAVTTKNKKLVIVGNAHKSVYDAVLINRLYPVFADADSLENILKENRDAGGILITSPTYEGIVSDIKKYSKTAHKYGIPLIVDQAHGAHLGMHEKFPNSAIDEGADIVVESLHKTLPSLTQTAIVLGQSRIVSYSDMDRCMSIFQTSSPSYVLMGSMSKCMDVIENEGKELFDRYVERLEEFFEKSRELKYLEVVKKDSTFLKKLSGADEIFDYDVSKILIRIGKNLSGKDMYDILLKKYGLQMEMAGGDFVLAMTSAADTEEGFSRLEQALFEIDRSQADKMENIHSGQIDFVKSDVPESVNSPAGKRRIKMRPADAVESEKEIKKFADSVGEISGEYVYVYPPEIPVLMPGEVITGEIIEFVMSCKKNGLKVLGTEDKELQWIQTVKRNIDE